MIWIERAYKKEQSSGFRVLVDRVWPRGVSKDALKANVWMKDIAPSASLRKWFNHDPQKWPEFKTRYTDELKDQRKAIEELRALEKDKGEIVLVYGAKDDERNQAVVLKEFLESAK